MAKDGEKTGGAAGGRDEEDGASARGAALAAELLSAPGTGSSAHPISLLTSPRSLRALSGEEAEFTYDLCSVVCHHGVGLGSGHYTAYGRATAEGRSWRLLNDATTRIVGEDSVQRAQGYLLFYERREPPR